MINIFSYSLGELATNCYIVAGGKNCIIIDPADSPEFIAEEIQRKNLLPKAIVATHGHFDHILGVAGIQLIFQIPFLINRKDGFLITNAQNSAQKWLNRKIEEPNPKIDKFLENKDKIKIGDEILEVIETPGHTPGSICLYNKKNKIIFTGDLLFKNGVGRTDFSYGDENLLKKSLKKIFKLPPDTIIYPGHGPLTKIKDEKQKFLAKLKEHLKI